MQKRKHSDKLSQEKDICINNHYSSENKIVAEQHVWQAGKGDKLAREKMGMCTDVFSVCACVRNDYYRQKPRWFCQIQARKLTFEHMINGTAYEEIHMKKIIRFKQNL